MKKLLSLITLLACAGSLYAAGAGTLTPSSVGFESNEGYVADTVISNTLQETGKTNYQWWSAGSDEGETGTIKLYNVAAEPPAEEGEGGEAAPASETEAGLSKYVYANQNLGNFENIGPGDQYLNVETTTGKPLYRTLATWENNFRWVKTEESGEKVYWNDSGDPDQAEQGTVWQKEYQVNSVSDLAGVEIGSEGKVIDTLVQFTASETGPELADGDKLVVWLKQQTEDDKPANWEDQIKVGTKYIYTWTDGEETKTCEFVVEPNAEPNNEQMAGIPEEAVLTTEDVMQDNVWPCYTNLMVTAGQLNGNFTVDTNTFTISANEGVLPDKWYRLTIRAIENVTSITGANQPGFAIYLDGVAVTCKDNDYQAKLFEEFDVAQLSSTAKDLYDNKQLFISAVSSDKNGATALTAVGFDGTGKIDDLTINTVEAGPQFAMGKRLFKVEWDNGLTGFTIVAKASDGTVISTTPFSVEGGAGANEFDFADGATTYEISALTFASGSTLSEVSANGAAQTSDNGVYSFTGLAFAPVVKIGVDTILATVDGTDYSNFADAIAAAKASGKTLTLAADIPLTAPVTVEAEQTLVINLAGNDLVYNPSAEQVLDEALVAYKSMFAVSANGSLTILDEEGGGKVAFAADAPEGIIAGTYLVENGGEFITGSSSDVGATFEGMISAITTIYSGYFDGVYCSDLANGTETFGFTSAIAEGSSNGRSEELHPDNYGDTTYPLYWVVTQSAGGDTPDDPEPIEYTITISGVDVANATVTVGGVEYSAEATYKYTGTPVVIVATADNGYTYTGVKADGWAIAGDGTTATNTVSGITANVTVTVPAALQKADEPEGPTSWEEVTKDMEVSQVVDSASKDAFTGSGVTARDIADWAVTHNVEFSANGISVTPEALMLNCPNTAAAIATAKEAFKVDDTILERIMANLEDITKVNLSEIKAQYPYANIVLEEVTLGEEPSPNAKFFKLKMTLKK